MARIVVGEIERPIAVADDEELQEAEDCFGVAIPGIVLVLDDLLHGATRANAEGLQFDLNDRHPVNEEYDVKRWWLLSVLIRSWLTTSKEFLHQSLILTSV